MSVFFQISEPATTTVVCLFTHLDVLYLDLFNALLVYDLGVKCMHDISIVCTQF